MRLMRVTATVVMGVLAGWGGYWIGHALGWSQNADWPWSIGGGAGAITLSAGMAVAAVVASWSFFILRPVVRNRRLAKTGAPAQGLVLDIHDTGLVMHRHGELLHQSDLELEVHAEGTDPYIAHTYDYLDDRELTKLLPGSAVSIRFDPRHPRRVAIEHDLILN